MSGYYSRDKVKITPITKDPGTGAITRGTAFNIKCMVENETKMVSGGSGRPVQSNVYVFMPPETSIKKGDIIQVVEQFGEIVTEPERTVIQASKTGGFSQTHKEVYA